MNTDKKPENTPKVGLKSKIKQTRIVEDYGFRTVVLAIVSLFIGIFFAILHAIYAVIYDSVWFALLATHYLILSIQRISILLISQSTQERFADNPQKKRLSDARMYSITGAIILIIAIDLAFAVVQISLVQSPPVLGMTVAILSAAYTTYKMTMGIINAVRAKRFPDPVVKTIRNIDLIDAVVSLFVLETTLIGTFGAIAEMRLLLVISGAVACAFKVYLSLYMIIRGSLKIKKIKAEAAREIADEEVAPEVLPDETVEEVTSASADQTVSDGVSPSPEQEITPQVLPDETATDNVSPTPEQPVPEDGETNN